MHTNEGQKCDLAWIYEREIMLTNLIALYNYKARLVMTINTVYLYFIMAFSTFYHSIITDKMMKYRPDKWTMRWNENRLNSWAQRVV